MQLVDPEDIPAIERLTQEVLLLREKVASVEPQSQEVSGNQRQQVSSWDTGSSGASTAYLSTSVQSLQKVCVPHLCTCLHGPLLTPVWHS